MQVCAKRAKVCMQCVVYISTELSFCVPSLVVGLALGVHFRVHLTFNGRGKVPVFLEMSLSRYGLPSVLPQRVCCKRMTSGKFPPATSIIDWHSFKVGLLNSTFGEASPRVATLLAISAEFHRNSGKIFAGQCGVGIW